MKTLKSRFLINHVGFLPKASKHFSYKGVSKEFRVNRFQDLKLIPVFCGKLVDAEEGYKRGDFSEITEEGIYRISTEEGNSRCFIISPNVYKTAERILVNYFTWQRCGDDLGWNGKCHTEDAITLQNGEVLNLSGGHHQSSDLRKWTFGTSIGIAGLAEFALREQPLWDRGILAEELWHAAEYYLKLITKEGWLISCTWVPEGYDVEKAGIGYGDYAISWEKRQFFEIPDNEHSHWQTIKTLALIGKYFRDKDVEKWERCINGAEKIWEYMQTEGKKMQDYKLPLLPPLGHDGMARMFQGFYEGSAFRYASCVEAACKLFEATEKYFYKEAAMEALDKLCELQVGGDIKENLAAACFWESKESEILANNYYYFYCINVPMAFADVLELWPEAKDKQIRCDCLEKMAEQYIKASEKNSFGRIPSAWFTVGHDVFAKAALFSFSTNTNPVKEEKTIGTAEKEGKHYTVSCENYNFCYNLDLIAAGIFLAKASKILKNKNYGKAAQCQLDWIMGANPFDASSIEGVGYNQPHRGIFGEFFPPVPQIPGAVFTGITEESFEEEAFGYDCEYDMPMVGWLLFLYSQLDMVPEEIE